MRYLYTLENERGEAMSAFSPFTKKVEAIANAWAFYEPYNDYQGLDLYIKKWTQDDYGLPKDYVGTIYHKDLRGYYNWLRLAVFKPDSVMLTRPYRIVGYVKGQVADFKKLYKSELEALEPSARDKFVFQKITRGITDDEE